MPKIFFLLTKTENLLKPLPVYGIKKYILRKFPPIWNTAILKILILELLINDNEDYNSHVQYR